MPVRYKGEALAQVVPRAQAAGQSLTTDELLQVTNFYAELARTTPVERRARGSRRQPSESFARRRRRRGPPDLLVLAFAATAPEPRRRGPRHRVRARLLRVRRR